jgi:hypothetical protein
VTSPSWSRGSTSMRRACRDQRAAPAPESLGIVEYVLEDHTITPTFRAVPRLEAISDCPEMQAGLAMIEAGRLGEAPVLAS